MNKIITVYVLTWFDREDSGIVAVYRDFFEAEQASWKDPRYCEIYEEDLI